jgi:hypothetical protein
MEANTIGLDFRGNEEKLPANCDECLTGFQVLLKTNRVAKIAPTYGRIRTEKIP